ncbi:MAG: PRK06851 family protein [Clostridia bacterium]|jgi:hypothetical protein
MTHKGRIRHMFSGGNTSVGFFSFFQYIMGNDATRIFILKGGPGVGKSTLMRKIGEAMLEKGYDIEYFHCSSDPGSLDGIAVPKLDIAMMDGTAPHMIDPKTPGAVDEIINLGGYWNEDILVVNKTNIQELSQRMKKAFSITYSLLKEGRVAYDEWSGYIAESMDRGKVNKVTQELRERIFAQATSNCEQAAKARHLFASGITPEGLVNYTHTLLENDMDIYCMHGAPGTGVQDVIGRIANTAHDLGIDTEQFHCPFNPEKLDLLLLPSLKVAVVNTTQPAHRDVGKIEGLQIKGEYNLSSFIRQDSLVWYMPEVRDAGDRYANLLDKAIAQLKKAKALHDELENYYVPAMDFEGINKKQEEVLERVLKYSLIQRDRT